MDGALVALLGVAVMTICVTNVLLAFGVYLRAHQPAPALGTVHNQPNGNGTLFYEIPKRIEAQVISAMRKHGYSLLWSRPDNGTVLTLFEMAS